MRLPDALAELVPKAEWKRYEAVVDRHGAATHAVAARRAELAEREQADEAAALEAVEQGKPIPPATTGELEDALDDAERELRAVEAAIPGAVRRLHEAAEPFLEDAARNADARFELELEQVTAALEQARTHLRAANTAAAESEWTHGARVRGGGIGAMAAWYGRGSNLLGPAEQKLGMAEHELGEARARRAGREATRRDELEYREQVASDKAAHAVADEKMRDREAELEQAAGREVWSLPSGG